MSDIDEKLKAILSESVIILEANRDVGPRKWELALELFYKDALPAIKQAFADEPAYPPFHDMGELYQ